MCRPPPLSSKNIALLLLLTPCFLLVYKYKDAFAGGQIKVAYQCAGPHHNHTQPSCSPLLSSQVYKYKDAFAGGQIKVEVYISFGGLLMLLVGDPKKLQDLEVDSSVYLLVRKV